MKHLNRRTFLRGAGAAVALPALDAMLPAATATTATTTQPPLRLGFVYLPNGVIMPDWSPQQTGSNFDLPRTLQPLAPLRHKLQILSGLMHDKARANGDGAGDHARALATFLTGVQARKTAGADIHLGVSVDQVAAQAIGHRTRLRSLELSCDAARRSGQCDSGYSCAYQYNLSWNSATTPVPAEVNPRHVFERLFADHTFGRFATNAAKRHHYRQSILDFIAEDARSLQRKLGRNDQRKLEEYLHAIREIEQRIEHAEHIRTNPDTQPPNGIPPTFREHLRLMFDLQVLAFETDTTRIATFLMAHDGSNRSFPLLNVPEGHHNLSHHQNDAEKIAKLQRIDQFYVEQFTYFLQQLAQRREGETSLLDNCMIVYGGGISDGNKHQHHDLPVILAGGGAGTLTPGRHTRFDDVPMTNLYLALLDRLGVDAERHGDSTGILHNI